MTNVDNSLHSNHDILSFFTWHASKLQPPREYFIHSQKYIFCNRCLENSTTNAVLATAIGFTNKSLVVDTSHSVDLLDYFDFQVSLHSLFHVHSAASGVHVLVQLVGWSVAALVVFGVEHPHPRLTTDDCTLIAAAKILIWRLAYFQLSCRAPTSQK